MKKIIFSLSIILFGFMLFAFQNNPSLLADETRQYYAKISSDEVYLYSQPNESNDFREFKLPTSYFVLLTAEANNRFYSCKYGDVNGYIKKEDVLPMNGTPVKPYANFATTYVLAPDGIDMRSTPYKTPVNVVARLGFLEDNILFYGSLEGDNFIPKKTNIWYYCKYINPTTSQSQFGYLYSFYCDTPEIPLNMEEFAIVEGNLFPSLAPQTPKPSTSLSGTAKTLIIVGVSLPCVVILYLLIKPTLITEKSNKRQKSKPVKKKRHGDYFEFDESDLN